MAYRDPLRTKWNAHRCNAKRRGIPFRLSFEQWLRIWMESGHINEMGRRSGQYVMARNGDDGAYEVGNVSIITCNDNHSKLPRKTRLKMSASQRGRKHSHETKERMRQAHLGRKHSKTTRLKISESNQGRLGGFDGKHHSEKTKRLQRKKWRNQYGASSSRHS